MGFFAALGLPAIRGRALQVRHTDAQHPDHTM
jgi:hypothetical protein